MGCGAGAGASGSAVGHPARLDAPGRRSPADTADRGRDEVAVARRVRARRPGFDAGIHLSPRRSRVLGKANERGEATERGRSWPLCVDAGADPRRAREILRRPRHLAHRARVPRRRPRSALSGRQPTGRNRLLGRSVGASAPAAPGLMSRTRLAHGAWSRNEQLAVTHPARESLASDEQLHADQRMRADAGDRVSAVIGSPLVELGEVPASWALVREIRPAHLATRSASAAFGKQPMRSVAESGSRVAAS